MKATNLIYLTITGKKRSNVTLNHLTNCLQYCVCIFSFLYCGSLSALSLTLISLRKILNLPLFHRVNVRIMDISDILGEGGFIQWRSAL